MKRLFFLVFFLAGTIQVYAQLVNLNQDETLLIFVRHTERAEDGTRNPPISSDGIARANNLSEVLKKLDMPLAVIYSTDYKRTQMTALPTAFDRNLPIKTYGFDDVESWLDEVINTYHEKAVLIVGHSNTTPRLVNLVLGESTFDQLDEHDFGDIFYITTTALGTGQVTRGEF